MNNLTQLGRHKRSHTDRLTGHQAITRQRLSITRHTLYTDKMKRNYAIDSLRLIAVCLVIYIHIFEINKGFVFSESLSWKTADVFFGLSRLAVPVFFAISGWYIFSKS